MHPPAPRLVRHAALLLLAHRSALRRHALPGTPITALAGASNYGFSVERASEGRPTKEKRHPQVPLI